MVNDAILKVLQWILFIASTSNIFVTHIWIVQNREKWKYSIPILLFTLHTSILYLFILLNHAGIFIEPFKDFFHYWSVVLRLQVVLTVFLFSIMFVNWEGVWKKIRRI